MNNLKEKKENNRMEIVYVFMYIIVFVSMSGFLFYYLHASSGHLPLMDYWKEGADYLYQILYEPIKLENIISFPHPIHWNVLYGLSNYFFVRIFKCDNYSYVYAGMIVMFIIMFIMIVYYNRILRCDKIIIDFFGAVICLLPIINLNQWEILTLFCSYAFMIRICLYIMMWLWLETLMKKNKSILEAILYSITSFLIIMFASQAYYPGFVSAICGTIILYMIINKNINASHIIIIASQVLSVVVCYVTTEMSNVTSQDVGTFFNMISDYFKAILFMLAATVVPVTMQVTFETCYMIGGFIFILVLGAIYIFFNKRMYERSYLPMAMLLYAFVNIIIIISGRMYSYGFASLGSSRYVVETTIGLMGVLQIYWYEFTNYQKKNNIGSLVCIVSIVCAILFTNTVEMKIGPYRKIYYNNMQYLAENIEQATDEELAIFQAPASDVREMVQFMKEHHLCIWSK